MRLFVYGSLMRGERAHRLLAGLPGARRVARGSIAARLLDLGGYPGAVAARDRHSRVAGELWEIDDRRGALRQLDRYERFDRDALGSSLFVRRRAVVRVGGRVVRAWAYFVRRPPVQAPVVASGDWRRR